MPKPPPLTDGQVLALQQRLELARAEGRVLLSDQQFAALNVVLFFSGADPVQAPAPGGKISGGGSARCG